MADNYLEALRAVEADIDFYRLSEETQAKVQSAIAPILEDNWRDPANEKVIATRETGMAEGDTLTLPESWWDEANEAVLDFIAEKTCLDLSSFSSRRIQPGYPDRVCDGDYRVSVVKGRAAYVLAYSLKDGVFDEAYELVKRPFDGPEEVIQL